MTTERFASSEEDHQWLTAAQLLSGPCDEIVLHTTNQSIL